MPNNRYKVHEIKDFVAKGKRDYNTTNLCVSKRKLFVIYEATFKKPRVIT